MLSSDISDVGLHVILRDVMATIIFTKILEINNALESMSVLNQNIEEILSTGKSSDSNFVISAS